MDEARYVEDPAKRAALAADIRSARPSEDGFSVWFLGQNSFVLKSPDGTVLAIDPYLSDWCATRGKTVGRTARSRRFAPPLEAAELETDLVLLTHSHCDHADPETLAALAGKSGTSVVGPFDACRVALNAGFPEARVRTIHAGEEIAFDRKSDRAALVVRATFAMPTDGTDYNHIGFVIRFPGGATFWDSGDSSWCDLLPNLCASSVRAALPAGAEGPDVMAVCINAGYGNLSHWDAARLASALRARFAVPTHWDLFPHNSCDPDQFKASLERLGVPAAYAPMERARRYDFTAGSFRPA